MEKLFNEWLNKQDIRTINKSGVEKIFRKFVKDNYSDLSMIVLKHEKKFEKKAA